ncbi:hypothetical protein DFH28DRAFT_896690 [Melampsora americana]|nr:hypothetical protein DFH28DRAFT_896690 [Melampsora americana]
MVGHPYISLKYTRVSPSTPLPKPNIDKDVGLTCPECPKSNQKSLVYYCTRGDTVSVKCPTTQHYIRTFKLNQLNHEIALINAGAKYPIPFDESAHGPPVDLNGNPFITPSSPKKQKPSTSQATRAPPSHPCARVKDGPTATGHKPHGHGLCIHKYCKSCCLAYVPPGTCYVHRTPTPPSDKRSNLSNGTAGAQGLPQAKRARIIPAQCAQSLGTVGRLITEDGQLVLAKARAKHAEAVRKASNPSIDAGKVVSLHLVHASDSPVISQFFENWPVAILSDSQSLMREAQGAAGLEWNRQLVVWDESVKNWLKPPMPQRELGVDIPHSYNHRPKNLVICFPNQRSTLATKLQDVLEGLGLGKPNVPRTPSIGTTINLLPAPQATINNVPAAPVTVNHVLAPGKSPLGSNSNPICLDFESDLPSNLPETPKLQSTASKVLIDPPSTPESRFLSTPVDIKPLIPLPNVVPLTSTASLRAWPGKDVLASSLLHWYLSAGGLTSTGADRLNIWVEHFGSSHKLSPKTVYRYGAFVDEVGYQRMLDWVQQWPLVGPTNRDNITVAQARRNFQKEFNVVSSLPNSTPPEPGMVIAKAPRKTERLRQRNNLTPTPKNRSNFFVLFIEFFLIPNLSLNQFQQTNEYLFQITLWSSPETCFTTSEHLGWQTLPYDQYQSDVDLSTGGASTDLAFGIVKHGCIHDVNDDCKDWWVKYKWGCAPVNIIVDQFSPRHRWDGRTTYPAVWLQDSAQVRLDACALAPTYNTLQHHLRFAQMYVHAACLLQKFKMVFQTHAALSEEETNLLCQLHIVENLVLHKKFDSKYDACPDLIRWFNVREKVKEEPEYITSEDGFAPKDSVDTFLGRLLECFTHWTYEYHGRQALLCGFRGSKTIITDFLIMDNSRPWFLQNTYTGGLQNFAKNHVCGTACHTLGLTKPPAFYPVGPPPFNPFE